MTNANEAMQIVLGRIASAAAGIGHRGGGTLAASIEELTP